jgi:protein required for attachment to host cells
MTWVITANSSTCHIYNYDKSSSQLTLLKEILHPESRVKKSDELTSDKPGHFKTNGSAHGSYCQRTDPKEVEFENFSREIAKELDQGRNSNLYKQLIIITPPHMNGLLNQHMNKHVKDLIVNNIQKDAHHLKDHELLQFLKTNAQYPD